MLKDKDSKNKSKVWQLLFQPDSDRQFVSEQEMPWILLMLAFNFVALVILMLFKVFTS